MKVSIILPVYNSSTFIKQAIDSIMAQTFHDFELIIINDGSTDDSEAIIKSFTDKRIRYICQENHGVAATLNKGIELAQGEYIWRHDADDVSVPIKLEEQFNFLEQHKDISLCACQVAFMTERGKIAWTFRQPGNEYFSGEPYRQVVREHFNPYSPITHGTVLMRTEIIKALGGYRSEFITGEDIDLWLRLIMEYKAVVLNQCLSFHRLNRGSATQKHGWKNAYFKHVAFKYYDQREKLGSDDLHVGKSIELPAFKFTESIFPKAKAFRSDIIHFLLPLHLSAKDYLGAFHLIRTAIRSGYKINATWKGILIHLLGKQLTQFTVNLKRIFK